MPFQGPMFEMTVREGLTDRMNMMPIRVNDMNHDDTIDVMENTTMALMKTIPLSSMALTSRGLVGGPTIRKFRPATSQT